MKATKSAGLTALTAALITGGFLLTASPADAQTQTSSRNVVKVTLHGDPVPAALARQQGLRDYYAELYAQEQAAQQAQAQQEQAAAEAERLAQEAPSVPEYNPANDPAWWFTPQPTYIPNTNIRFLTSPAQTFTQPLIITQPPLGLPYGGYFGYPGFPAPVIGFGTPVAGPIGYGF
mgnify:FL=1